MIIKRRRRGFLNTEEGLAAFEAKVDYYNPDFVYGSFEITDCNRKISLNFDFTDSKEKENTKFKIDTLIKELEDFRKEVFEQTSNPTRRTSEAGTQY
jgi:hypothetical protein